MKKILSMEESISGLGKFLMQASFIALDARKGYHGEMRDDIKKYLMYDFGTKYIPTWALAPFWDSLGRVDSLVNEIIRKRKNDDHWEALEQLEGIVFSTDFQHQIGVDVLHLAGMCQTKNEFSDSFNNFIDVCTILGAGYSLFANDYGKDVWSDWFHESYDRQMDNLESMYNVVIYHQVSEVAWIVNEYESTVDTEKQKRCIDELKKINIPNCAICQLIDFSGETAPLYGKNDIYGDN